MMDLFWHFITGILYVGWILFLISIVLYLANNFPLVLMTIIVIIFFTIIGAMING